MQQCYDVAGEYDYVVVVATAGMPDCRELVDRLLLGGPRLKRLVTLPVFDAVKRGLELPVRTRTVSSSKRPRVRLLGL